MLHKSIFPCCKSVRLISLSELNLLKNLWRAIPDFLRNIFEQFRQSANNVSTRLNRKPASMVAVYDDEYSALGISSFLSYSTQVVVFAGFFRGNASVPFFLQNFLTRGVPYGTYCCLPFFLFLLKRRKKEW
jgi:hypothetical protein